MKKHFYFEAAVMAALVVGPSVKYAPDAGSQSTTVSTKQKRTTTTSTNTSAQDSTAFGLSIQTVPDTLGLSIGGAYYDDNTFTLTLGVGL